jgi:hypothetical protein
MDIRRAASGDKHNPAFGSSEGTQGSPSRLLRKIQAVIPGRCESIEPGISRFPDVQLHI